MKKIDIPYKWELIALLWFAFFFNQADRQIFNIVLPSIRDDLGLTDASMGLVAYVFTLFYGVMVPVGGILGDRIKKIYTHCQPACLEYGNFNHRIKFYIVSSYNSEKHCIGRRRSILHPFRQCTYL